MRAKVSLFVILILAVALFSVIYAAPAALNIDRIATNFDSIKYGIVPLSHIAGECIVCELFADAPDTGLIVFVDDMEYTVDISVYYENSSASPPRQPIRNAMILIYMYNESGISDGLWRVFTDDNGDAQFDFEDWSDGEFAMKILYCPFCCPVDSPNEWCGWNECLDMAEIEIGPGTIPEDVPVPAGQIVPSELNCNSYRPSMQMIVYNPPPDEPTAAVPVLCTIGLLIFALLGGALHLSGRNPFVGFNLGNPRVGRHIRYQARGRGWALNLGAALSTVRSATQERRADRQARTAGEPRSFKERFGANSPLASFSNLGRAVRGRYPGAGGIERDAQGNIISSGDRTKDRGNRRVLDDSAKLYRQGRAYLQGGKMKGGEIVSMTRGQRTEAYGRFVGKQIVSLAAGLFDRSLLGRIINFSETMSGRWQERLSHSEFETQANAIAAYEHEESLRGSGSRLEINVQGSQAEVIAGEDCSVIETEMEIEGETTQVRIIVRSSDEARIRRALSSGNLAGINCLLEVPTGTAGQTTRYDIRDGQLHQVQRVFTHQAPDGTSHETIVVYNVGEDNRLTLSGAVVDGQRYRAVGTGEGRVGFFSILSAAHGDVPEELASSASFTSLGSGAVADLHGGAAEAIGAGVALSGQSMQELGMNALSSRNRELTAIGDHTIGAPQVMDQIRNVLDTRTTIITEQYNEALGLIETERGSLFSAGSSGDNITVRIVDSGAVLDGETRARALQNGAELRITDGRIVGVTDADGHSVEGVTVAGGRISVSADGGTPQSISVDGGALLDRDRQVLPAISDRARAVDAFVQVWAEHVGERLESQYGQDRREALDQYARILSGSVETVTPEPSGATSPEAREIRARTIEVLEQTSLRRVAGPGHTEAAVASVLDLGYPELAARARSEAAVECLGRVLGREDISKATPEAAAAALGIRVDQLVEVAQEQVSRFREGLSPELAALIPTFDRVYQEHANGMVSELPASERRLFIDSVRHAEELSARPAYEHTASRLFQESAGDSPLARLGLSIADMDEGQARAGLQALGLERREVRSAMRDFSELQDSARTYRQAASDAAARAPSIGNQAIPARDALLTFVPPAEELAHIIPRQKDETEAAYDKRVQEFRRDTASHMADALSADQRTDTAGELGTDAGRHAALDVCSRVLIRALDTAAEANGGRVEGYQTPRYLAEASDLLGRLSESGRRLMADGAHEERDGAHADTSVHSVETDYSAFLATTIVDGASRMPPPTVGRDGRTTDPDARSIPVSVYHTFADASEQYIRGNHAGHEEKKGEETSEAESRGSLRLFEEAAAAAHRFVVEDERRRAARRTEELREATDSLTGAPRARDIPRTPPPSTPPSGDDDSSRGRRVESAPRAPPMDAPPDEKASRPRRRARRESDEDAGE